ncbi:hypothetical protein H0E84_00890 [Luteimonas sp. SJ-92]|uniref:Uncharacterized protein n=1 Tax=Luteimonas salinisoli TaxID=2752307 RepID=A0A853J793_9GAMM|nr:DUF6714 family protein [Luteimonas salinisoli]NZA24931.1 hypothetical protein [Luteimonas salinisoli]
MVDAERLERLWAAFSGVQRPAGLALAPHQCDECDMVRRLLELHTNRTLPIKTLNWLHDSLPLLGPEGLRYWLPAYIAAAYTDPDFRGVDLLIFHLGPSAKELGEQYWRERLAVFDAPQREQVLGFVDWFATNDEDASGYEAEIARARALWGRAD